MSVKRGNRFRVHWTPERVIEAIQQWQEEHNEPPRRTDWDSNRCHRLAVNATARSRHSLAFASAACALPSVRTVVELFGSWNAAIEAAGLIPRLPSQRTARGTTPSHFLSPLGHVMSGVYKAEDMGDVLTLQVALRQLAALALQLADQLDDDEETLARAMSSDTT